MYVCLVDSGLPVAVGAVPSIGKLQGYLYSRGVAADNSDAAPDVGMGGH